MRKQHWALLVVAVTAQAPTSAPAQPVPRACLDWHKDPAGALPRKDVDNVVYRPLLFKRAGQNYDVETFSDMSPVGMETCFRWEIVNSSPSPDLLIDELAWPAAGIRITRMRPGDANRDYNNRREQIPSAKLNNSVYAFEKEETPTLSWITTVQNAANPPGAGGGPGSILRRTGELLPALKNAEPSIMNAIVSVLTLGGDRRAAPEILQVVGYGGLSIQLGTVVIPGLRFAVFLMALLLTGGLALFMARTETGQAIQATALDRYAARLVGIDVMKIYALTFAISSALAGAAAIASGFGTNSAG